MELPYDLAIILLCLYPREMKCSHKNSYMNVYGSIVYNSQKVEAAHISSNGLIDKQIAITYYIYCI